MTELVRKNETSSGEVEVLALVRLGFASAVGPGQKPGESVVETLLRTKKLSNKDASRVRDYLAKNQVGCACGAVLLPDESALAAICPRCRQTLVRRAIGSAWQASKMAALPGAGSRVGPLELIQVLGKGAQGTVYLARHHQLNRMSALKLMPAVTDPLDPKRRRFEREVEALARLTHPSIVRVHATFEVDGCLACEMELVQGQTLEERIEKQGPLPWREAAALVARLARATAHAHGAGVLHRDLKPANVLIREGTGEPVLADFGLTRLTDLASSLTVAGAQLGTPFYMAPEAFSGDTCPQTDVYGLGTILYQCLTGNPPFREQTIAALFHKITKGLCEPTNAPGAPPLLEEIRKAAMAPEIKNRYPSADALASDLEELLAGRPPTKSSGMRFIVRAQQKRRSRRRAAAIALGVALVALPIGGIALRKPGPEPTPAPSDLTTPALAVAFLEQDESSPDATRRQRALATISNAAHGAPPAQQALGRELDAAIARSPRALELRRQRALLDRARALPIAAADLAAIGSLTDGASDLDAVATHALGAGLLGPESAIAARSVWAAHKDSKPVAVLFVLAAASAGDPTLHDDVEVALREARSTLPRVQLLERAIQDTDRLAVLLEGDEKSRESAESLTLIRRLTTELPALQTEPGFARAPSLVMAPLAGATRELWRSTIFVTEAMGGGNVREDLVAFLDRMDESITPQMVVLREFIRMAVTSHKGDFSMKLPVRNLDREALLLEPTEPLLAAFAWEIGAVRAQDKMWTERAAAEKARVLYARAQACVVAFDERTPILNDSELSWRDQAIRRIGVGRSQVEEALAHHVFPEPGEPQRAWLRLAIRFRREAFAVSRGGLFANVRQKDARKLLDLLVSVGDLEENEPLLEFVPTRDALVAEARRRKDPRAALSLAIQAPRCAEAEAVAALACSDLGDVAGAHEHLKKLVEFEANGQYALIESLGAKPVQTYVDRPR